MLPLTIRSILPMLWVQAKILAITAVVWLTMVLPKQMKMVTRWVIPSSKDTLGTICSMLESTLLPFNVGSYLGTKSICPGCRLFLHPNAMCTENQTRPMKMFLTLQQMHFMMHQFPAEIVSMRIQRLPILIMAKTTSVDGQVPETTFTDNWVISWKYQLHAVYSLSIRRLWGYDEAITGLDIGLYFINAHHAKITLEYHRVKAITEMYLLLSRPIINRQFRLQTHIFL